MEVRQKQRRAMLGMMLSGAFLIFFTGYSHVWSIYQPYITEQTGWSAAQASLSFYLENIFFVVGNIFGGRLQNRLGARRTVALWGGCFALGVLLSAFAMGASPLPLYLSYGVLQGLGCGAVYAVILSTAQKWFPARAGFASGVIVTSNGLCAFVLAPVSRILLAQGGPRLAFLAVGGALAAAWGLCTLLLAVPVPENMSGAQPGAAALAGRQCTSAEMIRTRKFYLLLFTMLFGLLPYYIVSPISQTLQLGQGVSAAVAVGSVMLGSVLNAGTRFALPTLADHLGRIPCVRTVLTAELLAMLLLTLGRGWAATAAVVLLYVCFGGIMGNFPSLCSDLFGLEHAGENYGYVMIAVIAASLVSPSVGSAVAALGLPQTVLFAFGCVCAAVAEATLLALEKQERHSAQKGVY